MAQKIRLGLSPKGQYFLLETFMEPRDLDEQLRKVIVAAPARYYQAPWERQKTIGLWKFPISLDWFTLVTTSLGDRLEILPAAAKFMEKMKDDLQLGELIHSGKLNLTLPPDLPLVTKPFHHQEQALALLLRRKVFGLFMDMGTGKTKVLLDLCACLKKEELAKGNVFKPFLVIAPLSVVDVWKRQAAVHQPSLKVHVLSGSSAERDQQARDIRVYGGADIIVVNYESSWRISELKYFSYTAMVLDEATRIKQRSAKQAKGALALGRLADRRYILTGTPMPNNPLELWNQLRFLDPTILGDSFYLFRDMYAVMGGYGRHEVVGWKNLDDLSRKLSRISYTVKKSECLDLPPKTYTEYRVDLPKDWAVSYTRMARDLVAEIQGTTISVEALLAKLTKLRQMASGFVYAPDTEELVLKLPLYQNPKIFQLVDLLQMWLSQNHKCVIWGIFKEELNLIESALKEILPGGGWVRLDGSVPQEKRADLIEKFQTDPKCMVFVGQQRAGGLGITLTAGKYCVFFSNDYSPEIRLQCEDRLHRIGQNSAVTYVDIIAKKTIDGVICQMLKNKQKLTAIVERHGLKGVVHGDENITEWKPGSESGGISNNGTADQFCYGSSREAERDQSKD